MADMIVARRYAGALYEEADAAGRTEAIDADVDLIRESLDGSPELVRFFGSPVIPAEKKSAVVRELFGPRVEPLTLRFLELVVEKRRESLLPTITEAYRTLRDEQQGIVEAHARSAAPLGEAEREALTTAVERMTDRKVRLDVTVDPSLLGGVVVRVGDTVYDGSVRHRLASLREQLVNGRVPAGE